uniref:Cell growth regulator with EF-hand domain 1 n=1 Tax=Oryzias melastigma TaxID=30732 RepID=A0A3B3BTY9_ORYME
MCDQREFLSVFMEVPCKHRKIRAAFHVFDHKADNTVDVREVSTIIYSLGCFPTKADIHRFVDEVEEDNMGYVHLDKFLPVMTKVLLENKNSFYFQVLDKERRGYMEPQELAKYMKSEGETFSQEEMNEMLTALVDEKKNLICYKELISQDDICNEN